MVLAVAVVFGCFAPGALNADSLFELEQLESGAINDQHAPLLLHLWRPLYALGTGPAWVLAAQLGLFSVSAFVLVRHALTPRWAAVAVALIMVSPPVLGGLVLVGRDAWFLSFLLAAAATTLRAALATEPGPRVAWTLASLAAAWFALAARQNGGAAVVVVLAALLAILLQTRFPATRRGSARRLVAAGAAGLLLTVAMMGAQSLARSALGVKRVHPEQYLFIYDLAGISMKQGENVFPPALMPDRGMEVIQARWLEDNVRRFVWEDGPPLPAPMSEDKVAMLRDAWRHEITSDPVDYLHVRATLFARQVGLTRDSLWIFHPGIDPNRFGLAPWFPRLNTNANDYLGSFADERGDAGGIFRTWPYLIVAALGSLSLLLFRPSSPGAILVAAIGLSTLTYQVGLFFSSTTNQYRLEFPVVAMAMLVVVVAGAELYRLLADRFRHQRPV